MTALIALLVIVLISLIAVRVGATALMMTGLNWDAASFQATSAFFGVGFTTHEAEMVVNHRVRRRIIRDLILAGNVGLTSAVATLVVTLLQSTAHNDALLTLSVLLGGLSGLFLISRMGWFQRLLDHWIQRTLERAGMVRALDYELLLRIQHGYAVSEIDVQAGSYLAGHTLGQSRPRDLGVIVLSIRRDGQILPGLPSPNQLIRAGDSLTVYGDDKAVKMLTEVHAAASTPPNPLPDPED